MTKRLIGGLLVGALVLSYPAHAATSVAGKLCRKVGASTKSGGVSYTCVKVGKKLVWKLATVKPITPTPTVPPITPITPPLSGSVELRDPIAYPKIVTASYPALASVIAPAGLRDPGTNTLRLFLFDPNNASSPLTGSSIFYKGNGSGWTWAAMNADGTVLLNLAPGSYQIDVVETNASQQRKTYTVMVPSVGPAVSDGIQSNSAGYLAMTVDVEKTVPAAIQAKRDALTAIAKEPASTFKQTSPCQLRDQVTANRSFATDLSAGFPKVRVRLQSFGHIKALVVPIDFSQVTGKDDPVAFFAPIAKNVRDFYFHQSYGQLGFDFEIVPNWVRANFSPTKYQMGSTVGAGDPMGYVKALVEMTDPAIDFSAYDIVYFLVPKEMPMSSMGYGPGITQPLWTSTGYLVNAVIGGADMYYATNNGIQGGTWKWMAHETGHTLGLYDEDWKHESSTLGYWSIMAMNWSNEAIELGAWDRYLQGWLPESQINCVTAPNGSTYTVEPLVRQSAGVKAVMVPLSATKILVIESRRSEGLDRLPSNKAGVLVYTVDMTLGTLGGAYKIIGSPSMADKVGFTDGALATGQSVTVEGVTVKFVSFGANGDQVQVSRA